MKKSLKSPTFSFLNTVFVYLKQCKFRIKDIIIDMKKSFVVLIFFTFLTIACGKKKEISAAISPEQMKEVLRDVHLAEAAMQGVLQEEKDSMATIYYYHIFKLHKYYRKRFLRKF